LYDFEGNIENILTLDVNETSLTEAEVLRAVKYLKNGKSGGTDGIQPELLKHAELITPCLTNLFNNVWQNKEVPTEWRNSIITPLFKKVTCQTATTGGASRCYQCQAKCLQA